MDNEVNWKLEELPGSKGYDQQDVVQMSILVPSLFNVFISDLNGEAECTVN